MTDANTNANTNTNVAPEVAPEVAPSPLSEADPNSLNLLINERINDIFNRKPGDLTDTDLRLAVSYYRRERATFAEAQRQGALPKVPRKTKVPKSVSDAIAISPDMFS